MALQSYIMTKTFKAPCVQVTGVPSSPQAIRFKTFRVNEIIKGEMKHANNQPAFVLVGGVFPIPVNVLREIVTKDVHSSASGATANVGEVGETKKMELPSIDRLKYVDGVVFGALVGVGVVFLAEKQKWIEQPDKKHKIYGAVIGALAGCYLLYRYKTLKASKPKEKE